MISKSKKPSDWRIVFAFAFADLFSKGNRGTTTISFFQIAVMIFFTTLLITVAESYTHHLWRDGDDPVKNKIDVRTDIEKGKAGFTEDDYEVIKSLRWTHDEDGQRSVYPKKTIEFNGWDLGDIAYLDVSPARLVNCTISDSLQTKSMHFMAMKHDNPYFTKMDYHELWTKNPATPIVVVREKVLKESMGYGEIPDCIQCDNLRIELRVVVDKTNRLPYEAVGSNDWFSAYWSQNHSGNGLPMYQKIIIFPKKSQDVVAIASAMERLGYKVPVSHLNRVEGSIKLTSFSNGIVFGFCFVLVLILGMSQVFNIQYVISKKRKEIGFMQAYGLSLKEVNGIFIVENLLIAFLALAGALLFFFGLLRTGGIEFIIQNYLDVGLEISPMFAPVLLAVSWSAVILCIFFATIYSVWRVIGNNPASLLRM